MERNSKYAQRISELSRLTKQASLEGNLLLVRKYQGEMVENAMKDDFRHLIELDGVLYDNDVERNADEFIIKYSESVWNGVRESTKYLAYLFYMNLNDNVSNRN